MYSKTQGHHCWWLNKNGKALANFDDENEVDAIIDMQKPDIFWVKGNPEDGSDSVEELVSQFIDEDSVGQIIEFEVDLHNEMVKRMDAEHKLSNSIKESKSLQDEIDRLIFIIKNRKAITQK